tara:strand:+ start:1704 stop:2873 length:1170 start_codon:yes stop_codon:yes gene_type:complete
MPFFVGNVLPSSDAPGENDSTFDFTTEESRQMSLKDVPIRIEHEEGLAVGRVQRDWTDGDGKKWILGQVEDNTLEGRFASHAIRPSSSGHTLYKGLSLQHVHTSFSDGSTAKRAIEVSLCAEPRRPGCAVTCVDASKKKEYITHLASRQTMSAEPTAPVTETPVTETPAAEPTPEAAPAETESTNNREELMKLVIEQEGEIGSTKAALEKAQSELVKLQEAWKTREDAERTQTASKAEALSKALVDSWSASLPADMMTDDNKRAIMAMAQNFPKESVKMLEIAHKASKKYAADIQSLEKQQAAKERQELEARVHNIVTKKRKVMPETTSVVHAASTKTVNPYAFDQRKTSSAMKSVRDRNPQLFSALSGYSSGSLRDRMQQIANINGNN